MSSTDGGHSTSTKGIQITPANLSLDLLVCVYEDVDMDGDVDEDGDQIYDDSVCLNPGESHRPSLTLTELCSNSTFDQGRQGPDANKELDEFVFCILFCEFFAQNSSSIFTM